MSALVYRLLLVFAVIGAFFWLQIPVLNHYSLQVFAFVLAVYFFLKKLSNIQRWQLLPNVLSAEMPLVTFAFLLLIGSTGNLHSLLFPLSYVHLFFLVFAGEVTTAMAITLLIILFHYGLTPELSPQELANLMSLPLLMFFFIFAKAQYQQAKQGKNLLEKEEEALITSQLSEAQLETFLSSALIPRLSKVQELLNFPQQNQSVLRGHVTWLQLQVEQLLHFKKDV